MHDHVAQDTFGDTGHRSTSWDRYSERTMSADEMNDFAPEEFHRRLEGLRKLMAASDMDAVLVTTEANHRYFTGHVTHRWSHKYVALFALLPLEGEPVLIVPTAEGYVGEEDSWIDTIRSFPPAHMLQGIQTITDAVRELGLEGARIGTEMGGMVWMRIPHDDFRQLRSDLPGVEFVDASSLCWQLRARKSPAEIELIRRAVAITDEAYAVLLQQVKPGMTEREVYCLLAVEHLRRGAELPGSITLVPNIPGDERNFNRTLRRQTDRVMTSGELITHDLGGIYRGYWSDYTRMFALGETAAEHHEHYRVVYDCMWAAIEATAPGRPIADLVRASTATMTAAGHAAYAEQVTGIGHATGLDIIEPPFIALEGDQILEEGMVLTVEPGLVAGGAFHMLEEDVLVTATGYEVLSQPAPPQLPVL
jgi:Xaa-Pro dipeptidase